MSAKKNDSGKMDHSLIPQVAVDKLSEALMVGCRKYSRFNYCAGMEASRIVSALLRHAFAWNEGAEFDKEDGHHHLGAVMACCAMILRQQELGTLLDDRYRAPSPVATTPTVAKIWEVRAVPSLARETTVLGCYQTRADAEWAALNYHVKHWPAPSFKLIIEEVDDVQSA